MVYTFKGFISFYCLLALFVGDMLDELTADVEGYNAYFSFSRKKRGYSG